MDMNREIKDTVTSLRHIAVDLFESGSEGAAGDYRGAATLLVRCSSHISMVENQRDSVRRALDLQIVANKELAGIADKLRAERKKRGFDSGWDVAQGYIKQRDAALARCDVLREERDAAQRVTLCRVAHCTRCDLLDHDVNKLRAELDVAQREATVLRRHIDKIGRQISWAQARK